MLSQGIVLLRSLGGSFIFKWGGGCLFLASGVHVVRGVKTTQGVQILFSGRVPGGHSHVNLHPIHILVKKPLGSIYIDLLLLL